MDKIILSGSDMDFILQWRDDHKDLVRLGVCPLKAVKIICADSDCVTTAIRDDEHINLGITCHGKSIGKLVFKPLENGLCSVVKNTLQLPQELMKDAIQDFLTVYLSTMAFLVFGNATVRPHGTEMKTRRDAPRKNGKTSPKKKYKSCVYILNRTGNVRLMPRGSHNSPDGMFSVRGHYRHYKDGKVIWVSEYVKGRGEKKGKIYKTGLPSGNV